MEAIVSYILMLIAFYLILGFIFSIAFLAKGIDKVDPDTKGASFGLKMLFFPGVVIFWIVFATKWLKAKPNSEAI